MSFYKIQGNTQKIQAEKALQFYPTSFSLAGANSNKSNYLVRHKLHDDEMYVVMVICSWLADPIRNLCCIPVMG
jgi:hypothetical protein